MRYFLALMLTLNLLGDFAVDATAIAANLFTAMPPPPSLYLSLPLRHVLPMIEACLKGKSGPPGAAIPFRLRQDGRDRSWLTLLGSNSLPN